MVSRKTRTINVGLLGAFNHAEDDDLTTTRPWGGGSVSGSVYKTDPRPASAGTTVDTVCKAFQKCSIRSTSLVIPARYHAHAPHGVCVHCFRASSV